MAAPSFRDRLLASWLSMNTACAISCRQVGRNRGVAALPEAKQPQVSITKRGCVLPASAPQGAGVKPCPSPQACAPAPRAGSQRHRLWPTDDLAKFSHCRGRWLRPHSRLAAKQPSKNLCPRVCRDLANAQTSSATRHVTSRHAWLSELMEYVSVAAQMEAVTIGYC